MFCALDVSSTVAWPTVIESNGGFGWCWACRTKSSVLSLFNRRLFKRIHWFSSRKQTSTIVFYKKTSRTMLFHGKSHIWRFFLHLFFSLQPFNLARIWSNVSAVLWLCAVRHSPSSTVKVMDLVWIGLGVKSWSSLSLFKYHSRLLQNSTRRVSTRRSSLCITHEKPFVQPKKCFLRKKQYRQEFQR